MHTVNLILLILGAVCFLLSAIRIPSVAKVDLVALGLLAWILVPLIATTIRTSS